MRGIATVRVPLLPLALAFGCSSAGPGETPDGSVFDGRVIDSATGALDGRDAPIDGAIDGGPILPLPEPTTIAGPLTIPAATYGPQPFLTPAAIDDVLQGRFSIGREFFVAAWRVAPDATRPNLDGLGPLLHAPSCVACHPATGRPRALGDAGAVDIGLLFRLARGDGAGDPVFGRQLQPSAIAGVAPEAAITYTVRPDGGLAFTVATDPTYGDLAPGTHPSARLSPHLAGMGLLEAVDDDAVIALEDPLDRDGDGISGRAARLPGGAIGRFGWKAIHADLPGQITAAFAGDIGITTPAVADDCTQAQPGCTAVPGGGTPELATDDASAVAVFSRLLGVPAARRDPADPVIAQGHALFASAQCERCHRQALVSGADASPRVLANITFHAYTDLLLHDLGTDLADTIGEGDATAAEWRTPPLWGLGLVEAQPDARFLHDGRAATLVDAIRWHGGEAARSRDAFMALSPTDQAALLAFLRSL